MGIVTTGAIITAAAIGAAATVGGAAISNAADKKKEKRARTDKGRLMDELDELEASRKDVINPYEDVVSLDSMIVDNSGMLSNPFENIGVATQAAEFQAEEADIALANTLDLLASTGASAGGATALAQAALQSKRGISASIESQEAKNQKLVASGEQFMQGQKMTEAQRVQNAQMTEAQRMQQADVLGKEFVYGEEERRITEALNRKQAQITGKEQAAAAAAQSRANTTAAAIGAVGNIASSAVTAGV
jgi:hypothetical protein